MKVPNEGEALGMATEKKGRAKRQHFVPRCLLKRFSETEQATSVFVIGSATFVKTAGIKTQCAADYYYGHEQSIESALGRLESAFSEAIGDLSVATLDRMSQDALSIVRAFVHVQAERTPFAGEVMRNTYLNMGQQLYSAYAKANELPEDDAVERAERFADHQMPTPGAHTVELAVRHQSALADLAVKFVVADGFIVSDHPALSLNLWRDEHPRFGTWPTLGGLATKGFMYLMPIATNRLAVIYDSDTYEVGGVDSRVARAQPEDVIALNALQTINASRLLFDSTVVMPVDLAAALNIRNQVRAESGSGPLPLRPAGIPLSFLRVIDREPYDGWDLAMLPPRPRAGMRPAARDDTHEKGESK
ncbi:MAG: DUF4238 domain-containing protein [Pseudomonadota bacterium]